MIVYPAIDLMGGQCVRLRQGRFDDATIYSSDPAEALARFAEAGATWAHIVDLDGARAGAPIQHALVAELARSAPLKLQVAGGFRTGEQVAAMIEAGVGRVVIGSLAVEQPEVAQQLVRRFGIDRLGLALDVNLIDGEPIVATRGWTRSGARSLFDIAALHPDARHLLVTDIGRDGMMQGPNIALMEEVRRQLPERALQASGGVSGLEDIRALARTGAAGAIVGKALWEGGIDLAEAIECATPFLPVREADGAEKKQS